MYVVPPLRLHIGSRRGGIAWARGWAVYRIFRVLVCVLAVIFDVLDSNGDLGLDTDEVEYSLRAMNDGNPLFRENNAQQMLGEFDA